MTAAHKDWSTRLALSAQGCSRERCSSVTYTEARVEAVLVLAAHPILRLRHSIPLCAVALLLPRHSLHHSSLEPATRRHRHKHQHVHVIQRWVTMWRGNLSALVSVAFAMPDSAVAINLIPGSNLISCCCKIPDLVIITISPRAQRILFWSSCDLVGIDDTNLLCLMCRQLLGLVK